MTKFFPCPYCAKQYPHSAGLIGRKLRCSECKNIIQLKSDGNVIKVGTAEGLASTVKNNGPMTRKQLTSKQKKQVKNTVTRSIERSKSLLSTAAKDAIDRIDLGTNQKVRGEAAGKSTQSSPETQIIRSNYDKSFRLNSLIIVSVSALLCIVILLSVLWEPNREVATLQNFSQSVGEEYVAHPYRMLEYRNRMWLHTRDGQNAPPIILDADDATVKMVERVEWDGVSQLCNRLLKDMSLLRRFGMWVSSDKQVMVGKLWKEFDNKSNLEMFYSVLREHDIKYIFCEAVPVLLAKEGVSKRVIYIASLLLAGTGDKNGGPCRDMGLASDEYALKLEIYEFNGDKSLTLVDKDDEYEISGGSHYSGLIAGFIDTSQGPYEFRIIDTRFARSMDEFYEKRYNPLHMITKAARIGMLNEFVASDPDARIEARQ